MCTNIRFNRKAKTPLGDKNSSVVYNIPCKCEKFGYVGETERKWGTRKGEHEDKVRLTKTDVELGKKEAAEKRMNTGDGGLARKWHQLGGGKNSGQRAAMETKKTIRRN